MEGVAFFLIFPPYGPMLKFKISRFQKIRKSNFVRVLETTFGRSLRECRSDLWEDLAFGNLGSHVDEKGQRCEILKKEKKSGDMVDR